ncbi:MAG: protein phosphatase 2C domain-containing protein [Oscillatoria princeps RMCB-10]|jgi:hypothetical protein|nr:protein phosphatase 2C domain-containing protein [Oscillatoria princeps RMCB-10]
MGWKAIASSATGTSHKQGAIPCQDYGDYVTVEDIIVGAVADGAGSAKYSHIGAKLAVETALSYLKGWLKWLKDNHSNLQQPILQEEALKVFNQTLGKVVATLKEKASNRYSLNDLACTLLVFVATPEWIAAMQVGDGFIVVSQQDSEYQLLFPPDKGEYANETTFVTSENAKYQMRVRVLLGHYKFICASTDGLERLAISTRDWMPSAGFFQPFEEGLTTRTKQQEKESLQQWLDSKEVNAKTDDDKTLLLCVYERKLAGVLSGVGGRILEDTSYVQNKDYSGDFALIPGDLVTQTLIVNVLAGCLLQANYDLAACHGVIKSAVAILVIVAITTGIFWCITLSKLVRTLNKRFGIIILTVICGIGLPLGRLLYVVALSSFNNYCWTGDSYGQLP